MKRIQTNNFYPAVIALLLLGACDLWPREIKPLAEWVEQRVAGETTVWLAGGDVLVINIAGSPLYEVEQPALEEAAIVIAEHAIEQLPETLESIAITFHEQVAEDDESMRELIFLVVDRQPVLQSIAEFDATGPLTDGEIHRFIEQMGDSLEGETKVCTQQAAQKLASSAGDPETLDPARLEFLPSENWGMLDAFGKRLILTQAIVTQAMFSCVGSGQARAKSIQS